MIDLKQFREHPEIFRKAAEMKHVQIDVDEIRTLDKQVRALKKNIESLAAEKNAASKNIAQAQGDERTRLIDEMKVVDRKEENLKEQLVPLETQLQELLYKIPNLPFDDVPIGKDETENVVAKTVGKPPVFTFEPQDHLTIGERLGMIDTRKAADIAGARFTYVKGDGVRLQFALIQFVFETLTNASELSCIIEKAGLQVPATPFIPVLPPLMMRAEVMKNMARLDAANADERYYLPKDNLYLIGSAEHTLGPLHMDETLEEKDLPIRYIGYSSCFRREAGSYGKDTRGIIRVHQFDKLEMECFTLPDNSREEQDFLVALQEYFVGKLGLAYQVMKICTGDMGTPDARQIDINTWIPSQNTYRETHTSDLMTDYQSRRLNTRVKREDGATDFVHMNDATALAMGRILVAILENYQQEDGSVVIPEVLRPYLGGKEKITPPKRSSL